MKVRFDMFGFFILWLFAITVGCNGLNTPSALHLTDLFSTQDKDDVACYRIPALLTTTDGTLLAAIDQRVPSCTDLRDNKNINIVMRRSTDQGNSWSAMDTIIDYPFGISASDPSMILDASTGDVFLFFNYMDLENANGEYRFKMIRSEDHGLSWSEPEDITSQISKIDWKEDFKFITSGKGIQTAKGMLLHTLVNLEKGLHVFGSEDHGKSWFLLDTPIHPGDESKILELADGSWMINSRVADIGMRFIHTSADYGRAWISKADSTLLDPACNASLIRYTSIKNGSDKNRLLFSNARSPDSRTNISVCLSYNEGLTWPICKTVYTGSAAYSSLCVLSNGDIGLFFEKDGYSENVFVRLTLEWLTDGKDQIEKR